MFDRRSQVLVITEEDWLCTPKSLSDECVVVGHDYHRAMIFVIPATAELYFILLLREIGRAHV